jgi:hypothetical protein
MDSADLFVVSAGAASLLLSLFLFWRAAQLWTAQPDCDELTSASGPVVEAQLRRRFYSARWLDLSVDSTPLRVVPGPAVRPVFRALRREPFLEVRFCPSSERERVRLWEAHQQGRPIVTLASQRADSRGAARAALTGALVALLACAFMASAYRVGRPRR